MHPSPAPPRPHRALSLIPPMTQLNTPYPSTAYLTGFLRSRGVEAAQADVALELALRLLTRDSLARVKELAEALPAARRTPSVESFLRQYARYDQTVERVVAFLQGRDSTLAHRVASLALLPDGPRFEVLSSYADDGGGDPLGWAFGALGATDRARHIATLYLNDLADVLRDAVDPRFEFVRYAESLAAAQPTFAPLAAALAAPPTLIDELLEELTLAAVARHDPTLVLISVPFPGCVYGALRMAQALKRARPGLPVALGGGYVNTELRELSEPEIFDCVDFITLDAGERPLLALLEHLEGRRGRDALVRTFVREGEGAAARVRFVSRPEPEVPFEEVGTPTWDGLPIHRYLSLLDLLNPMHRLWSDGRWNKLTVAHGCYWKQCSFCDVSLDYISRYDAASARTLVDRVERIIDETGQTGFHLVDEAAPPKSLRAFAEELLRRGAQVTWWGNVRFEKTFTPALSALLAESGCIALSGGLEVASDRLLKLMRKGVTVEQVARVTHGMAEAGILVHAYLMYGFPTQTAQDTVDALEYVRQLFAHGCIESGFFHRFACTVHSPVGRDPAAYGVRLLPLPPGGFAKNDVGFVDPTPMPPGVDHDLLGRGLRKALYNFMHGVGLDADVRSWFELPRGACPRPTVRRDFVERALRSAT